MSTGNAEIKDRIKSVILADNQDITAAGILFFIQNIKEFSAFSEAKNKKELINELSLKNKSLVILDYTCFDFSSVDELIIIQLRFPEAHFLLFSEELTEDFLRRIIFSSESFSVLLKDCSKEEVNTALHSIIKKERFICNKVSNQLLTKKNAEQKAEKKLTATEEEILKLIALGKSTKEIANERFLSIHTVITHRKNIFRKLEVNNMYEATKYALKAGILDSADYYI